jgi:hypothetical protein
MKVRWDVIKLPMFQGGLNIINPKTQVEALLTKLVVGVYCQVRSFGKIYYKDVQTCYNYKAKLASQCLQILIGCLELLNLGKSRHLVGIILWMHGGTCETWFDQKKVELLGGSVSITII